MKKYALIGALVALPFALSACNPSLGQSAADKAQKTYDTICLTEPFTYAAFKALKPKLSDKVRKAGEDAHAIIDATCKNRPTDLFAAAQTLQDAITNLQEANAGKAE